MRFRIVNHSSLPIFRAVISDVTGPGDDAEVGFADHTPLQPATVESGRFSKSNSPMDLWGAKILRGYVTTADADEYSVTIRFMDANSLWWKRTDLGDPIRTDAEGDPL